MGERELECRRLQRHAVPLANGVDAAGPLDQFRRREAVVVRDSRPRVREDTAVEETAEDNRDSAFQAERQELPQCRLVEQGIAAGEEEAIELRVARKADEQLDLVHPGAHGVDRAVGPQDAVIAEIEDWVDGPDALPALETAGELAVVGRRAGA